MRISAYLDPRTHESLTTEDEVHAKDLIIEQGKQTNLPSTNPDHPTQAASSTTTWKGDKGGKLDSFLKMTGMSTLLTGFVGHDSTSFWKECSLAMPQLATIKNVHGNTGYQCA
ncbi:unnamed protein product [Didymodactylos carnosus]|uniref:Uncharacterized protein n=1 Tax=Didymodactylos carnosus TaxID=1234261 RepID=A0A8S2F8R8_9BILA|nr:unnamed protein product [Didymodactylos carnosus]CAF4183154.1 unnamed protein product [Didymodactylos carnosus]